MRRSNSIPMRHVSYPTLAPQDKPFPGKAKITLIGNPDSPEMPGYGSKNIAIREGTMTIHGLPKNPTWTVLQATANQSGCWLVAVCCRVHE